MTLIRLRTLIILIIFIFIFLFYRSYQLTFESPLPINFERKTLKEVRRGTIYDSVGNELAISKETASVGIRPTELLDIKQTAKLISPVISLASNKIVKLIQDHSTKNFFWLKRKIDIIVAQRLKKMRIPGVHIRIEPSRYYPNKKLASNLIGFVDIDNQGLGGVEFQYNETLTTSFEHSRMGHNIYLTIHSFLQYQLEKHLREKMEETSSKSAVGIISETNTGRILAISSLPNFNPHDIRNTLPEQRKNRAINSVYEPGSTFKIFTLAILLENHLIKSTDRFFCPGYIKRNGFKIRCSGIHKDLNMQKIIEKSCNTGIIEAALKIPLKDYYRAIKQFGFGRLTKISISGESRGIIKNYSKWDTSVQMSIPIGHGIATTPIQIISAANSIANGGRLLKIHIINKIMTADNKLIFKASPIERNKTVSPHTGKKVLQYLKAVTREGGTGKLANLEFSNIKVSGKTGTVMKSYSKGYFKDKYQASFLGFFPATNPKITIFILFDEPDPKSHYQGGIIAAPVFRKILRKTFSLLYQGQTYKVKRLNKINLDENRTKIEKNKMPNLIGRGKKDILRLLGKYYPGKHTIKGHGYVLKQDPHWGVPIKKPYQFTIKLGFPSE